MNDLPELLDHYFSLGVAEGKEGRDHDTPDGEAQAARDLIECQILRLRDELANMTISRNGYVKQTSGRVAEARRQAFIEAAKIAENMTLAFEGNEECREVNRNIRKIATEIRAMAAR